MFLIPAELFKNLNEWLLYESVIISQAMTQEENKERISTIEGTFLDEGITPEQMFAAINVYLSDFRTGKMPARYEFEDVLTTSVYVTGASADRELHSENLVPERKPILENIRAETARILDTELLDPYIERHNPHTDPPRTEDLLDGMDGLQRTAKKIDRLNQEGQLMQSMIAFVRQHKPEAPSIG